MSTALADAPVVDGTRRAQFTVGLIVVATLVVVPVVTALLRGALSVPFNDDWAYLRIARSFAENGRIEFIGWNDVNFVGILPFSRLVAGSHPTIAGTRVVGIIAAVAFASGVWCLVRRFLSRTWSAFATALTLSFPGFALNAPTFMTDLPSLAAQVWCVYAGVRAFERPQQVRGGWLAASVVIGLYGFSIRQHALVAPLAVLAVVAVRASWTALRRLAVIAVAAGVIVAFMAWRSTLAGGGGIITSVSVGRFGVLVVQTVLLLGLWGWPLLLLRRRSYRLAALGAVPAAVAGLLPILRDQLPVLGNTIDRGGALGQLVMVGTRPEPAFTPLALVLAVVASLPVGFAVCELLRRRQAVPHMLAVARAGYREVPSVDLLLAMFVALSALVLLATALFTRALFDRYLLAVVPVLIVLAVRPLARRVHVPAWPALALVALMGVVVLAISDDAQAFSAARWEAGRVAVAAGAGDVTTIDAGWEWVAYHFPGIVRTDGGHVIGDGLPELWYHGTFEGFRRTALVSSSPQHDSHLQLIRPVHYRTLLGQRTLYVYRVIGPVP